MLAPDVADSVSGSSPRMRGAQIGFAASHNAGRIIPADAGSTPRPPVILSSSKDHPRGCGEHEPSSSKSNWSGGSSPRMRGARLHAEHDCPRTWIIPADAGSTTSQPYAYDCVGDHPRGCGEHFISSAASELFRGSSPRMRGAQGKKRACGQVLGIIPADAGSTRYHTSWRSHGEDHPRGCGEHNESCTTRSQSGGSSPRMRGAL